MKINSIEEEIVKKYVIKNRQERILWEFSNPKKRINIVWRFVDFGLFKKSCLQPTGYMTPDEIEKCLFQLAGVKFVYFIGECYIGELPLRQAAKRANTGEICIIYCGNGIGYYQGEQDYGSPPRFLLIQKE